MKRSSTASTSTVRSAAFSLLAAFAVCQPAAAQINKDQSLVNSDPNYEAARERLMRQGALDLNFDKANLRDVLRLLATKAEIHFLSMPMDKDWDQKLITINMKMSPFAALETVANENGIALVYDRGVWHMRPFNDSEQIARTYVLKYNTGEKAEAADGGGSSSGGSTSGGGLGGGSLGGGGSSTGSGTMGGGLDLGAIRSAFKVDSKDLVDNVEKILGISTRGLTANYAGTVTVDEFSSSPIQVPSIAPRVGVKVDKDEANAAKVVWNSDSNALFVVASRQQHQMVQHYIESLDRPQSLIAVELKFVETTKDPKSQIGVDWSGTFDNGLNLKYGIPTDLDPITGVFDPDKLANPAAIVDWTSGKFRFPSYGVIAPDDISVKLNFLLKDRETSTVSYPRVLTMNNREVVMRSVVNVPVLSSSSAVSGGAGTGTSTSAVEFLPIGTTVNILPKRINDNKVLMQTKILVSNITGSEVINGNPYPVASSRVYNAPLEVESGYTVAIAGLDEATDSRSGSGLPVLSRIPVVGWAFKNRVKDRVKKNLMIFITPSIMDPNGRGVGERPISEVPLYHGEAGRGAPQIYTTGELAGGPSALPAAIAWGDREERRLRTVCEEGRASKETFKEIGYLNTVNASLIGYADRLLTDGGADVSELNLHRWNLDQLHRRARALYMKYCRNSVATPGI